MASHATVHLCHLTYGSNCIVEMHHRGHKDAPSCWHHLKAAITMTCWLLPSHCSPLHWVDKNASWGVAAAGINEALPTSSNTRMQLGCTISRPEEPCEGLCGNRWWLISCYSTTLLPLFWNLYPTRLNHFLLLIFCYFHYPLLILCYHSKVRNPIKEDRHIWTQKQDSDISSAKVCWVQNLMSVFLCQIWSCHWLSLAVTGCHWLSLAITGYHWLSLAITGCHWLSLAVTGYHWLR